MNIGKSPSNSTDFFLAAFSYRQFADSAACSGYYAADVCVFCRQLSVAVHAERAVEGDTGFIRVKCMTLFLIKSWSKIFLCLCPRGGLGEREREIRA